MRDCDISHNTQIGIEESIITSRPPIVTLVGSTLQGSATALQSSAGATLLASGNTFSGNTTVFNENGGQIFTGADNVNFDDITVGATHGTVPKI